MVLQIRPLYISNSYPRFLTFRFSSELNWVIKGTEKNKKDFLSENRSKIMYRNDQKLQLSWLLISNDTYKSNCAQAIQPSLLSHRSFVPYDKTSRPSVPQPLDHYYSLAPPAFLPSAASPLLHATILILDPVTISDLNLQNMSMNAFRYLACWKKGERGKLNTYPAPTPSILNWGSFTTNVHTSSHNL